MTLGPFISASADVFLGVAPMNGEPSAYQMGAQVGHSIWKHTDSGARTKANKNTRKVVEKAHQTQSNIHDSRP